MNRWPCIVESAESKREMAVKLYTFKNFFETKFLAISNYKCNYFVLIA